MTRIALRSLVLLAAAAVLAAGGGGTETTSTPVGTATLELPKSYRFEPEAIEVDAGTTVTWNNRDDFPHNVHLLDGSDRTEELPVGASASITFEEPGTIEYECSLHPQQMQGTVVVR
jgi:plastocyanin